MQNKMRSHCWSWGGILNLAIPCVDKDVGNFNITRNDEANTLTVSQPLLSQTDHRNMLRTSHAFRGSVCRCNPHTGSQWDTHRSGKGKCGGCTPSPLKRRCTSCRMDRSVNMEISNARKGELTKGQCAFSKNTLRRKGTCEMKVVLLFWGRGWEPWGRRKGGLYYTDNKHQALWLMLCFTQNVWRIFFYFKILLGQRSY